mmetsp:Transcript_9165/g.13009  ORF Transcript_9165/g.13009 Transcript_9165/m.13009 type:complete len:81 (+) Transcript_9165:55-297(+)
MSSGYGLKGGIGRCYPFFADYKECLKNEPTSEGLLCAPKRSDYFECLHHKKRIHYGKKNNRTGEVECRRNYFRACESLIL